MTGSQLGKDSGTAPLHRTRARHLVMAIASVLCVTLLVDATPAAAATGDITQLGIPPAACVSETGSAELCADGKALDGANGTAVSKDGRSVYIVSSESDSVAVFARSTTTGALTQLAGSAGCVSDTGAGGCVDGTGLDGARSVVVSGDGKSVYVVSQLSSAIAVFARNTTSGALTQLGNGGCISETGTGGCTDGTALLALQGITVSPDGTSVYTASIGGGVAVFSRQTTTTGGALGKLTQLTGTAGCISDTGAGGCTNGVGLDSARSVAVSADNKSVYVASFNSGAVTVFSRQTTTTGGTKGKLTQLTGTAGCISESGTGGCADGTGLNGLIGLAISADGKSVYTAAFDGDAVAVFSRQTTTTGGTKGKLTQLTGTAGCIHDTGAGGCADGTALESTISVTVSPDNKSVYATASGGGVVAFARQTTTTGGNQGKLTQPAGTTGCIHDTGAGGCTDGRALNAPLSIAVTADNKSVYVASFHSDAVAAFSRQTTTTGGTKGKLTQLGIPPAACVSETGSAELCADGKALDGANGTAVSKDGRSVYIVSSESDSVAVFARSTTTGALTQLAGSAGCVSDTGAGGCVDGTGLDGARSVVVSGDGKSVYVVSQLSSAIAVFARNTTSGALTQLGNGGCISETGTGGCTDGTALLALQGITVSPDGTSVYTASIGGGVAVFSRQTTTTGGALGKLTQLTGTAGCISDTGAGGCTNGVGLDSARSVAVSADNKSVYVASFNSGAVTVFSRQTTTTGGTKGKLTQLTGTAGCISESGTGGCADGTGLNGLIGLAISADGKSVYTAAFDGDAVAVFSRQTTTTGGTKGKLTQLTGTAGCIHDTGAGGCADGTALESTISVTVSPDNKSVYATASGGGVVAFARQTTTTGGNQGKLTQPAGTTGCIHDTGAGGCTDGRALNAPLSIAVTADNKSVYVASFHSDAVAAFSRQSSGGL